MERTRVMLIAENASVRSALRQALAGPDIEVVAEATPSLDAVGLARAAVPDLLLVDVDEVSADAGVVLIRALAVNVPDAVIVMLASSHETHDLFRAVAAGARGYLVKGLSDGSLRRSIRAAARGELAMPRELAAEIVDRAAGTIVADPDAPTSLELLSPRELEVLPLLAVGLTDHEIATALMVSKRTVEAHVASILRKLGARNRAGATRAYLHAGRPWSREADPR
jgi:DNA-binding NarL/FixJ family response regulator